MEHLLVYRLSKKNAAAAIRRATTPFAVGLLIATLGLATIPASAATVVVDTTTDQALGSCSGSCSLRDAVATASPGDTIQIPAGHYVLTLGHITITQDLILAGSGARTTVIDGNNTSGGSSGGIFDMSGAFHVEIADLSLVNGVASGAGNAISALDRIVSSSPFVFDPVVLTVRRCTIANNKVTGGQAGGIHLQLGTLNVEDTTLSNNTTFPLVGGGILAGTATGSIVNSTFSGNTAASGGGAMQLSSSTMTLTNNTMTGNQRTFSSAGGVRFFSSTLTMSNNVIAGNPGGDCFLSGNTIASDHNLSGDSSCGFTGPGDLPGTAPLLGLLADNGGPTDTHALLTGSPALDAGGNSGCPAADQRGVTRPQRGICDIGSVEMENQPPVLATDQASVSVNEGQTAANTGTVSDGEGDTVSLSASVGSVVNNGDGTWSWSFLTSDGPTDSQTVTITGDDGQGGTSTTTFGLTVDNVAPTITSVSNNGPIFTGGSATITVAASDVAGAADPLAYSFDCDNNGSFEVGPQAGTSAACTFATAGSKTVNVQVSDGDGGVATGSNVVTVVADADHDGIPDGTDNCPAVANPTQANFDHDFFGDACDNDIDGDGRANNHDLCPFTPPGTVVGRLTGCSIAQLCPCEGPFGTNREWRNHGQYVSCVTVTAIAFRIENLITNQQKAQIITAAAQSSCGR